MKIRGWVVFAGWLVLVWAAQGAAQQANATGPELVRAKMGILISSGGQERMAKARDRLKAGDMVRVYVHPEKAAYIYVIYSDGKEAVLLNSVSQETAGSTLVLPSVNESYEIDGTSPGESFALIASPKALPEVSGMFAGTVSQDQWKAVEEKLVKESEVVISEKSDVPFAIAGNVRGGVKSAPGTSAVKKLRIYSGNTMVVRTYAFAVQN